jgi:hypothetical protein
MNDPSLAIGYRHMTRGIAKRIPKHQVSALHVTAADRFSHAVLGHASLGQGESRLSCSPGNKSRAVTVRSIGLPNLPIGSRDKIIDSRHYVMSSLESMSA